MKKNLIKWGCLLVMFIISFAAKSDTGKPTSKHEAADIETIAAKMAADATFKELIDLEIAVGKKIRSLPSGDRKQLLAALNEKNSPTVLESLSKAEIDFKAYSSKKQALLTTLFKEYQLDKRSDKAKILKSAVLKLDPPTFAECLSFWSTGMGSCDLLPEQYRLDCFTLINAGFLACLAAMP